MINLLEDYSKGDLVIGTIFPKLSKKKRCSKRRPLVPAFNQSNFLQTLELRLKNDLSNTPNLLRIQLGSLKKKHLKSLYPELKKLIHGNAYQQWYRMAMDLIETKLFKPEQPKNKKRVSKFRMHMKFSSKAFDFLNLPSILRSQNCKVLLPNLIKEEDFPMVVFTLEKPIREKVFNYTKFVSSLDLDSFATDPSSNLCHCHEFNQQFVNQHHQHILTGDLSIVQNIKLRNLLKKGPKYRPKTKLDFDLAKTSINKSLNEIITEYIVKYNPKLDTNNKFNLDSFKPWKEEVMRAIDSKINTLKID